MPALAAPGAPFLAGPARAQGRPPAHTTCRWEEACRRPAPSPPLPAPPPLERYLGPGGGVEESAQVRPQVSHLNGRYRAVQPMWVNRRQQAWVGGQARPGQASGRHLASSSSPAGLACAPPSSGGQRPTSQPPVTSTSQPTSQPTNLLINARPAPGPARPNQLSDLGVAEKEALRLPGARAVDVGLHARRAPLDEGVGHVAEQLGLHGARGEALPPDVALERLERSHLPRGWARWGGAGWGGAKGGAVGARAVRGGWGGWVVGGRGAWDLQPRRMCWHVRHDASAGASAGSTADPVLGLWTAPGEGRAGPPAPAPPLEAHAVL